MAENPYFTLYFALAWEIYFKMKMSKFFTNDWELYRLVKKQFGSRNLYP